MRHRFLQLAEAGDFSYCGEPGWCAKCKCRFFRDFITPIERFYNASEPPLDAVFSDEFLRRRTWREHLVAEMMSIPFEEFTKLRYWEDHLRMAFYFIQDSDLKVSLLRHWITTCPDEPQVAQIVVSSLMGRVQDQELRDAWRQKAEAGGGFHP